MFGDDRVNKHLKHSQAMADSLLKMRAMGDGKTFEQSATEFEQRVYELEAQGKGWISNEHWFNVLKPEFVLDAVRGKLQGPETFGENPTWIPDEIFARVQPIILIRHPALSVRSTHRDALKFTQQRVDDEDFLKITENKTLRFLFDYFQSRGREPIVVDGEDLLWRTDEVRKGLCGKLGIDPEGLKDRWTPTSREEVAKMLPLVHTLTKTFHDSEGIERPEVRPEEPTIEGMREWWRETYGEEEADKLVEIAGRNLGHWEYLSRFKV